jgi:molybdate transport repressor ModE-like protein
MLNLTHLKVLETVARHGSVTEAAKELHYSQPSVSHHLGRLEAATGAKLIQRVGRGSDSPPKGNYWRNGPQRS